MAFVSTRERKATLAKEDIEDVLTEAVKNRVNGESVANYWLSYTEGAPMGLNPTEPGRKLAEAAFLPSIDTKRIAVWPTWKDNTFEWLRGKNNEQAKELLRKNPVELVEWHLIDGSYAFSLSDGAHRLRFAAERGYQNIPARIVESWGLLKGVSYTIKKTSPVNKAVDLMAFNDGSSEGISYFVYNELEKTIEAGAKLLLARGAEEVRLVGF